MTLLVVSDMLYQGAHVRAGDRITINEKTAQGVQSINNLVNAGRVADDTPQNEATLVKSIGKTARAK